MCKVISANGCCQCVCKTSGATLKGIAKFCQGAVTGYSISDIGIGLFAAEPSMYWLIPVIATGGLQTLLHGLHEAGKTSKKVESLYFMILSQIIKFSALGAIFYRNYHSNTAGTQSEVRDEVIFFAQFVTAALATFSFSISTYNVYQLKKHNQTIAPVEVQEVENSDNSRQSLDTSDSSESLEEVDLEKGCVRRAAANCTSAFTGCAAGVKSTTAPITNFFSRTLVNPIKRQYNRHIAPFNTEDNRYAAHSMVDVAVIDPITKALPFTAAAGILSNFIIDEAKQTRLFPLGYSSLCTWTLFPLFIAKNLFEQITERHSKRLDKLLYYPITTLGNMIMPLYMTIYVYVMLVHYSTNRPVNSIDLNDYFVATATTVIGIIAMIQSSMAQKSGPNRLPTIRYPERMQDVQEPVFMHGEAEQRHYGTFSSVQQPQERSRLISSADFNTGHSALNLSYVPAVPGLPTLHELQAYLNLNDSEIHVGDELLSFQASDSSGDAESDDDNTSINIHDVGADADANLENKTGLSCTALSDTIPVSDVITNVSSQQAVQVAQAGLTTSSEEYSDDDAIQQTAISIGLK